MKSVLLIGLGRFGRFMAIKLQELGNEVLAVDRDEAKVNAALERRTQAKKEKNYAEADRIRDELKALGVIIEDTAEGPKWKKV